MDLTTSFTPWASLLGGALIGLAAVLLMAANGRIAGISGIVSRLLPPGAVLKDLPTSVAFIVGLLAAAPVVGLVTGGLPAQQMVSSGGLLVVAGLLVGFGSVLGSGCTSGHGVCGISRLSIRSILATLTFMATGFIAVYVLRHVVGA